jgi:type III restriction enzyme
MNEIKTLHQTLIEEFGKRNIENTDIPISITENLNQFFPIRLYQKRAFQFFCNYWEESFNGKPRQNHQLFFHMATGSGKTLMMAGLILYLYEQGYRNFLFFVNSTNVIEKTRDNFLNHKSGKYLFSENLSFKDKRIIVREVANFQAVNQEDINIVFSTIQGLHLSLNTPHENNLTYDDFEDQKIVLLSDEAHHINADTKRGNTQQLTLDEMLSLATWEGTVERIFNANPNNVLLEFTATIDMSNENLAQKYRPRLIFDYSLKDFRNDGYSKEVKVLQSDLSPFDRAMQAVLLSQYRRKIFEKYKKHIKPVILLKSKTIKESQVFFEEFRAGIQGLSTKTLASIQTKNTDPALKKVFDYCVMHGITLENLVIELKEDFSEDKLISVNSKEESESKQLAVNSLEDERNEYRVVFAVDKLNEGWDVLNLFDIVRLYDTRDSKAGKFGKTTMSEAQLIGRGARYCPFQISSDQPLYERKFDSDVDHELRICEELYYHSAHNPKYIQELNTALQEIGIKPKETRQRSITIKDSFKETQLYKVGHIFLNEQIKYKREDINGLDSSVINQRHKANLRTGYTQSSVVFDKEGTDKSNINRKSKDYDLSSFGVSIIRKALQRLEFYEFERLRHYLPNLGSIQEFIASEKYLGRIKLEVSGLPEHIKNLSPDEMLDTAIQTLSNISKVIASDKVEFKGSKDFTPHMVRHTFTNKTLNFMLDDGGDKEFGQSMNNASETAFHLDLTTRNWYVFDNCFGTSEEKLLIKFIDKQYDALKKKYSNAYLIRNEKHFKLYNFDDGRAFEPDFVLYLIGKEKLDTMHYQVFIEPKGKHLLREDEWKERFLINLRDHCKIERLFTNKKYLVWGLPFYNSEQREHEFSEAFKEIIE